MTPATGHRRKGLDELVASRAAVHGSRDPQARDPHRDGESGVGASARARRIRQAQPPELDLGQLTTSVKFLIRDRVGQFTGSVDAVLKVEGIRILVSPPQVPSANAMCERTIGTLRRELFGRR
jgi:hypothetical protein